MRLEGKRFLITGASSGIGLRLALQLLERPGTRVVAVARDIEPLRERAGDRLLPFAADVAEPASADAMLAFAMQAMGGLDAVIACAGFAYYEAFEGRDYGHIRRIFDTNVLAPLHLLQRALALTDGPLSFTVISSALGLMGLPGYALYCATKFALDGFQDAYRFEPHSRLHFMTVYPIGVATPFWKRIHGPGAGGADMPLPRPLQQSDTVAKRILKGLEAGRRRVFTSRAFRLAWILGRVVPGAALYQRMHRRKFQKWLDKREPGKDTRG